MFKKHIALFVFLKVLSLPIHATIQGPEWAMIQVSETLFDTKYKFVRMDLSINVIEQIIGKEDYHKWYWGKQKEENDWLIQWERWPKDDKDRTLKKFIESSGGIAPLAYFDREKLERLYESCQNTGTINQSPTMHEAMTIITNEMWSFTPCVIDEIDYYGTLHHFKNSRPTIAPSLAKSQVSMQKKQRETPLPSIKEEETTRTQAQQEQGKIPSYTEIKEAPLSVQKKQRETPLPSIKEEETTRTQAQQEQGKIPSYTEIKEAPLSVSNKKEEGIFGHYASVGAVGAVPIGYVLYMMYGAKGRKKSIAFQKKSKKKKGFKKKRQGSSRW